MIKSHYLEIKNSTYQKRKTEGIIFFYCRCGCCIDRQCSPKTIYQKNKKLKYGALQQVRDINYTPTLQNFFTLPVLKKQFSL